MVVPTGGQVCIQSKSISSKRQRDSRRVNIADFLGILIACKRRDQRFVICGGGVVGACTAYFLSRRGAQVIVVESTEVAAAASGKAGGFLALDWCAGTPLDALARRSFQLHAALPQEIADDWGYRPMTAYSGFVVSQRDPRRQTPSELDWLSKGVVISSRLSTPETTAIVHPRMFTSAMMRAAQARGAELLRGRATGVVRHTHATTTGHNVWGILNAPATGEAVAELIADGSAQTIDLAPFNPMRLPTLDPSLLRTS